MPRASKTPWLGKEPNQSIWYIYWYDAASRRHRRRSSGTDDRSEAEKALGQFIIEKSRTSVLGPIETPDRYPIATALRWYLEERGPELASGEFAGRAVNRLIDFFGPKTVVGSITPQVLKRYETERKRKPKYIRCKNGGAYAEDPRGVTAGTIRRELVVLSAALNHAVANGRLTTAPKIIMPPTSPSKTRYLEQDEIQRLLEGCVEAHVRLFVTLAINTGARKGALLDMKWEQVDFANRIVYLNPEGRAQTNKRRAIVPMNDVLFGVLVDAKKRQEKDAKERAEKTGAPVAPCGHVVAYRNAPVVGIKTGFSQACRRAGIKGVTPHTLRHTAGTLMALAGIDLFLIAKVLGHSVQKTTELYAHFRPDYLRGAVDVLGKATGGCRSSEMITTPTSIGIH